MLTEERKSHLLEVLSRDGRLVARDVSRALGLSEDTIRRDLRDLASAGLLRRVHGGAVPLARANAPLVTRMGIASAGKEAIGRLAAGMIRHGQVVFLDGGTTALAVARHIPPELEAVLITHSPNVALELMARDRLTIDLLGGRLFRHSVVATGARTLAEIASCRPDLCFIGATGLHPVAGITTGDSEEAAVKRAVIARSGAAFVLGSSEKLGAIAAFDVAAWSGIEGLLISADSADAAGRLLDDTGCEIIAAP